MMKRRKSDLQKPLVRIPYPDQPPKMPDKPTQTERHAVSRKVLALLLALVAVVVAMGIVFLFPRASPPLLSISQFVDEAEDRDGDGIPETFARFAPGDRVEVEDRVLTFNYGWGEFPFLAFRYVGEKWASLFPGFYVMQVLDDFGDVDEGDVVRLLATVPSEVPSGSVFLWLNWSRSVGDGRSHVPTVGVIARQPVSDPAVLEVTTALPEYRLPHFQATLYFNSFGIATLDNLPGSGRELSFQDADASRGLSAGDTFQVVLRGPGQYRVEVYYARQLVANVSWSV